jgi:hypothetical protein
MRSCRTVIPIVTALVATASPSYGSAAKEPACLEHLLTGDDPFTSRDRRTRDKGMMRTAVGNPPERRLSGPANRSPTAIRNCGPRVCGRRSEREYESVETSWMFPGCWENQKHPLLTGNLRKHNRRSEALFAENRRSENREIRCRNTTQTRTGAGAGGWRRPRGPACSQSTFRSHPA